MEVAMLIINKKQTTLVDGNLVTEASMIGLAPGNWPNFIGVVNDAGEGYLFRRQDLPLEDDGRVYVASRGEHLLVFND
jgi:hypothetical protein